MSFQYKPGQVPFEKADRTKSFNELLGVVPEHISFPHFSEGKSKIENKVISRIRRCYLNDDNAYQRNIKLEYTYSSLGNITLNTCFEISYFGLESVLRFYKMYAEHAEPTTETFNLETLKTGELSGSFEQIDDYETPVPFESYIKKAHDFCIFTLNGEIYIKYYGHLIPFTDIIRFHELEGSVIHIIQGSEEIMFKLKFRITFITRMDCEIDFEQYKKGDPAIIEIGEDDINQVEAQKLIQIFNTFNPS
jgi:hypothetical protein